MNINHTYRPLGDFIRPVDIRNKDLSVTKLLGLSIEKCFIPSIANTIGTDMSSYKIVKQNQFAYGPVTSRNGDKITIALYDGTDNAIISQAYSVFEIANTDELNPKYLFMWFSRPEFDRYARYKSHGSAREIFDWQTMCETMIPVPSIDDQRRIVSEYETVQRRIDNNRQLINKLEETAQTLYKKMFVDGIDKENLPEGWRMGKLGEVCEIITGKKDVNEALENGEYRFFSCSPNHYYSNEYIGEGPAIIIAGNGSYTGRVSYYEEKFDLYQRTYACLAKTIYKKMSPYLYCVMKYEFEPQYLGGTRGSSIPYIVKGDLSEFSFIINKQCEDFSKKIQILISNNFFLEEENKKLLTLQKLMLSGMGR